ncbi:prepilin peptidase [Roseibacterium sp. SDUM158016]|uniref:prepilin peptidase n=1 Tax=Roseicyclus sediminis TaxID=2980997 RepID=UPI0021CE08CA|nr:prepilin peptidase [Roseibacterium sp. SDUM158016]MCU4654263.1 prepilin peptidase [Roseibacterium sp. SDUM158016]
MDFLPLLLLAPILVATAYFDLRYMRIPNWLVLAAVALFALSMPVLDWPEIAARLTASGLVFAAGAALFALRLFGGGDVKMMAALMLFVPSSNYTIFALGFSVAMLAGMATVFALRQVPLLGHSSWVALRGKGTFPMGVSIAGCGLLHPLAVQLFG